MALAEKNAAFLTRVSGKVVYGAIVLEALLGALSDPVPTSPIVLMSLALSLVVVTVAGAYSDWVGECMEKRTLTSWQERLSLLPTKVKQRIWILAPLAVPAVFFGLSLLGALPPKDANALTRIALLGVLFFFGFVAARLSGASVLGSLLSAVSVTLLGYVVARAKILAKFVGALGK